MPLQTIELPTGSAIAAIAALAAAAALAVWLIPRRQRRRWERSGLGGRDLAELENSARATLVQLLGGVALILTFVATWLQISDAREASEQTLRLTAKQQETERFTRAVEQLGSAKLEVRVGGIYGLQQGARDTPSRRETVAQLMVAYLKSNHRPRNDDRRLRAIQQRIDFSQELSLCASSVAPPWPDTQAALSVLLSMPRDVRPQLDLTGVDLIGVRMDGADFSGADLRGASLAGAKLSRANFDHAKLPSGTDLRGACLRNARFNGAYIGFVLAGGGQPKWRRSRQRHGPRGEPGRRDSALHAPPVGARVADALRRAVSVESPPRATPQLVETAPLFAFESRDERSRG